MPRLHTHRPGTAPATPRARLGQAGAWQLFRRFAPHLRICAGLVALTILLVLAAPFLSGAML
jgi:hypothetical protein